MIDDAAALTVRPERLIAGGEALARDADGRVVFVRGGVPGDEVTVIKIEEKGDWSRALIDEVIVASPDRVEPPCPRRRLGCGGCDWQHLAIAAQLPAKVDIVRDALRRTGKLPDADLRIGRSVPDRGYRTTVRVVGDADGRAAYRLERSHDTALAADCMVAHPALLPVLDSIRLTPELEVTVRTSAATGEITARWNRAHGDVTGLPDSVRIGPSAQLHEDVAGHRFRVSAASFFQSGPAAAELLVDAVKRAAPELEHAANVLDAYAGVGLFALAATSQSSSLWTVETSKSAVGDCRANLAGRDARVEQGEFGAWRPDRGLQIDVAIADPARSGLGRPGVGAVIATEAPVLVLVSCDPVALARDAALLARHGYRHDGTEALDLFPHTHHVECVTRFVHT
jgi:23S rRNA (uracil1939-C5)-methyltransferase